VTFLEVAVDQALQSCVDEVIVVLGKRLAPAKDLLEPRPRLRVIVDAEHSEKRACLIATALKVAPDDATGFFIAYADDRSPNRDEIDQFLSVATRAGKPLVVRDATHRDLLPMYFDRSLKIEFSNASDDATLRHMVERDPSRLSHVRAGADSGKPVGARVTRGVRRRTRS
jgi:CTP:molybdopterin cytidylyltransferase MocA